MREMVGVPVPVFVNWTVPMERPSSSMYSVPPDKTFTMKISFPEESSKVTRADAEPPVSVTRANWILLSIVRAEEAVSRMAP